MLGRQAVHGARYNSASDHLVRGTKVPVFLSVLHRQDGMGKKGGLYTCDVESGVEADYGEDESDSG